MKYSEHANVIGQNQSRCEADTLNREDLTTWQVHVTGLRCLLYTSDAADE